MRRLFSIPAALVLMSSLPASAAPQWHEAIPAGEDAAIETIRQSIAQTVEKEFKESADHVARRDAHAKGHGCVTATFSVSPGVPADLRAGVLAVPGKTFPAWVRFSNGDGHVNKDSKGDGRGMAVKLMNVDGDKLLPDERTERTQDFVMINGPVFFVRNAIDYVTLVQSVVATGAPFHFFFPSVWPWKWHLHEALNGVFLSLKRVVDPLRIQYWSMTPYRLGDAAVKFSAKPCKGSPRASTFAFSSSDPDRLRVAMRKHLETEDVCFDFLVQRQTNERKMPIEDPTIRWSESRSPFVEVARIHIPRQAFDSAGQQDFCENLSYTPWHSLPEHRPLGGINRVRLAVYQTISKLRHKLNGRERHEPTP